MKRDVLWGAIGGVFVGQALRRLAEYLGAQPPVGTFEVGATVFTMLLGLVMILAYARERGRRRP